MTTSDVLAPVPFGATGLHASPVGIGTAAWGATADLYGLVVTEDAAIATARAAFRGPFTLLDTSNNYGDGESERRIGLAIAGAGGLPQGFLVQTKLDRDPVTGTFEPDRMWRSLDESLERLGLDSVPVLYLHDPEHSTFEELMAPGGAVDVLLRMREQGRTAHIGISGGPVSLLRRFVATGVFEALITHNRLTLVDRTAEALVAEAAARRMAVLNAAVYGGGLLAAWPRETDRYHYRAADPAVLAAVDAMGRACERYDVPLAAAALQFSVRHHHVTTTVVGAVSPEQVEQNVRYSAWTIPDALRFELEALVPPPRTWIAD